MRGGKRIIFIFVLLILFSPLVLYFFYSYKQENNVMDGGARQRSKGKFIQLSKGITHYELAGPDTGKVLVLIHGGSSIGGFAWERNYNALVKAGFRVLRYDMYGRGYSDINGEEQTLELLTHQLKELVDSLHLKDSLNLAGVSMGGNIVFNFAHLYPEQIGKIILFDPAAINPGSPKWYFKSDILADFLVTVYWHPRAVDKQMDEFYDGSQLKEYRKELMGFMSMKGGKQVYKSSWKNILTEDCSNQVKSVAKHKKDVLLFWGKQDPVIPLKSSNKYLKLIPDMQLVLLDHAGHLSNYEAAEVANPIMVDFLKR